MTSTLKINTIEPEGATTNLAIGESGQNVIVAGNDIRANVLQDAGGNAILTSNGSGTLSGLNSGLGSAKVLISTQTPSASSSVEFTTGIDSTYNQYVFDFINIVGLNTGGGDLLYLDFSDDAGTSWGLAKTTTSWRAYQTQANTGSALEYDAGSDLAQSTSQQRLSAGQTTDPSGAGNLGGEMSLFNPSSTTYVKNFIVHTQFIHNPSTIYSMTGHYGGYINTTAAVTGVRFQMTLGSLTGNNKDVRSKVNNEYK